jgi:multidrug efflux pump subunit AcrB
VRKDPISRIDGVGDTTLFGSQYAMRIWLDPNKLNNPGFVNKAGDQEEGTG